MSYKGIDVSKYQTSINWDAVKANGIEFAIIKCASGDNIPSQDDPYFLENVAGCEEVGMPYGIYLYSYATNDNQRQSEIDHVLRLLQNCNPTYPVYLDLEDKSQLGMGIDWITDYAVQFCEAISNAGYKAGIYANQDWLTNYIYTSRLNDYEIWIANFGNNDGNIPELNYDGQYQIHQYTSNGYVSGINGRVDMNICYYDYEDKPDIRYKAHLQDIGWTDWVKVGEVIGTTGESRRMEAIILEGLNGVELEYRTHLEDIGWTNWVKQGEVSGTEGESRRIEAIEIKSNVPLLVTEHVQDIGWLPASRGENVKIGTEGKALRLEAFKIDLM